MRHRYGVRAANALTMGAALCLAFILATDAQSRARGARRDSVSQIIVHATGGPFCRSGEVVFSPAGNVAAMKRFFEASSQVSIHYIVGRDGEVARSVPESEVAVHTRDHNDRSIGIELINAGDGRDDYPQAQITALMSLVRGIQSRWRISTDAVLGHEDVDGSMFGCGGRQVRRKQDPGPRFPWERFRKDLAVAGHAPRR